MATIRDRILPHAHGPLWITLGVAWVALAQAGEGLPMATAIVVIGYGATDLSGRRETHHSRGDHPLAGMLPLANLLIYVALAGLAIATQWDLALRSAAGRLGPLLVLDHALAIGLLVVLTWRIASRMIADTSWP